MLSEISRGARLCSAFALAGLLSTAAAGEDNHPQNPSPVRPGTAAALVAAESDFEVGALLRQVMSHSPEIARAEQRAAAAAARVPQAASLPDPVAAINAFVLPAETRVGPQRWSLSLRQRLPWIGKLPLRRQAALFDAAAVEAEVEAVRLDQLTEARRLIYELRFLDSQQDILEAERSSLARYEQAAQAHYSAGTGLQQEIVRIQAQITRADTRLLDIQERKISLRSALNGLRDGREVSGLRFAAGPPVGESMAASIPELDPTDLKLRAEARRPELRALEARIAAAEARVGSAHKAFRPDVTVGLSYTGVDRRRDAVGRASPPEGNGDDVLALSGSVNLPLWRRKLSAGVLEAEAEKRALEAEQRGMKTRIALAIDDLAARIPLLQRHLQLLDNVLLKQAREALRSAEIAYSTGKLNAVDLLDAEVVMFEVRIASARTRADLAVARARLERQVAAPLDRQPAAAPTEGTSDVE